MGKTFAEKALARAAGLPTTTTGQIVDAQPDVILSHDNTAAIFRLFKQLGIEKVKDPQRLAIWTYRPLDAGGASAGPLTATEKRIARYLVNGFTSKEIAQAVGSSPRTVEVHRANMIRKMGVRNSFELVSRLLAGAGWGEGA